MDQDIQIRTETGDDEKAIADVTVSAFETLEISDHTEQYVIQALRAAGALTVSLVAVLDGRVVGHIAFSPVVMSDGTDGWYGLGPLSVLPDRQRQGIGTRLIEEGLHRLRELHARGCCLVGHPEYYKKHGFRNVGDLSHEGVPQDVFLVLPFGEHVPRGTVTFHDAFAAAG